MRSPVGQRDGSSTSGIDHGVGECPTPECWKMRLASPRATPRRSAPRSSPPTGRPGTARAGARRRYRRPSHGRRSPSPGVTASASGSPAEGRDAQPVRAHVRGGRLQRTATRVAGRAAPADAPRRDAEVPAASNMDAATSIAVVPASSFAPPDPPVGLLATGCLGDSARPSSMTTRPCRRHRPRRPGRSWALTAGRADRPRA